MNERRRPVPPRPAPLLTPAIGFMAGICISELGGPLKGLLELATYAFPFAIGIALLTFRGWLARKPLLVSMLVLCIALGAGFWRHKHRTNIPQNHIARFLDDEAVLTRLSGEIVTSPILRPAEKRNPYLPFDPPAKAQFILRATELLTTEPATPVTGTIRVSVETDNFAPRLGESVILTGRLYRPRGPRNPGAIDWARANRLQNIYAGLAVEGIEYVELRERSANIRQRFVVRLRSFAQSMLFEPYAPAESDEAVRLLNAMALGQRSAAGRIVNEAFLRTGTSHFLAVSGFHVGVLAGAVWWFVRRLLRQSAGVAAVATIAALVLYALLAEHNAPILRASTMGVLACVAPLWKRPLSPLNWLALAALCILILDPLQLFRAGFQLSFVATLGLFIIVPRVYRWATFQTGDDGSPADVETLPDLFRRAAWRSFVGVAATSVCLWLITVPLKLHHFGYFAPWSAANSIIVLPVVIVTIVLAFLTLAVGAVFPALAAILVVPLHGLSEFLLWIVDGLSQLPGTFIVTRPLPAWIVVMTYVATLLFFGFLSARARADPVTARGRPDTIRIALLSVSGTVFVAVWFGWLFLPTKDAGRGYALHLLSVGSGSATLFTTPDGEAALFDIGTVGNFDVGATATEAMRALGIDRLNTILISHANFDHFSGVHTLLADHTPDRIRSNTYFVGERSSQQSVRQLFELLPKNAPAVAPLRACDRFNIGDAVVEVLWPPEGLDAGWKPNDRSLVMMIQVHGRRVLIPGDIERDAIRALLAARRDGRVDLRADVLIAPHHGAVLGGDTEDFYRAVDPRVVIVSTAKPRPKLVDLVRATLRPGCRLVSTRDAGAVTVGIGPDGEIRTETPFAPP